MKVLLLFGLLRLRGQEVDGARWWIQLCVEGNFQMLDFRHRAEANTPIQLGR
jgi:cell division protein FtsW (lipid II flippase)